MFTGTANSPVTTAWLTPMALLPQQTLTFNGGPVQFLGYAAGSAVDSNTMLQIYIDGVLRVSQNAQAAMVALLTLPAGDHTVDFMTQGLSYDVTLGDRGLTIMSLT